MGENQIGDLCMEYQLSETTGGRGGAFLLNVAFADKQAEILPLLTRDVEKHDQSFWLGLLLSTMR